MPYILFLTILFIAASGVFSLYRQLQMLQQNSYFLSRYFGWIKQSYTTEFSLSAVFYCVITFLSVKNHLILSLILSALLLAARIFLCVRTNRKSIKKLVFTARIKRLFITAILILGLLLIVWIFRRLVLPAEFAERFAL